MPSFCPSFYKFSPRCLSVHIFYEFFNYASNIVVIKCLNGMAQAVCAAMDSLHWEGLIGTLAGDDTFIGIAVSESRAAELTEELNKLLNR
jgi:arginine repressor